MAQWIERREVMGSIPIGDSDFFFVPRSRYIYIYFIYIRNFARGLVLKQVEAEGNSEMAYLTSTLSAYEI